MGSKTSSYSGQSASSISSSASGGSLGSKYGPNGAGNCGSTAAITEYGINLGLLFQITDDLLDVTATAEELGKTPGKDARAKKATFPSVYGVEVTRKTIAAVHRTTCTALEQIDRPSQLLKSIADLIMNRDA